MGYLVRCEKHGKFYSPGYSECKECSDEFLKSLPEMPLDMTSILQDAKEKDSQFKKMMEEISGVSSVERKPVTSARHNEGKVQTREVYPDYIMGIGDVLTASRAKYDHFNWCKPTKLSTPYESAMRHLMAFQSGEDYDSESGKHHLLHVATNIMFMYYHNTVNKEESDDRFFKKTNV